jgi:UDP-N-acetylglucosamine 2-epimerase (non-hydrolysing)
MIKTRVLTIAGTRPEFIRLSEIIKILDKSCHHFFLNTMQNAQDNLNKDILNDLNIHAKANLWQESKRATFLHSDYLSRCMNFVEVCIRTLSPSKILILGDTNSALASAIIASKMRIPIYHMEAGNRCWSDSSPEETNRKIIDSISNIHMPYTELAKANLIKEGKNAKDIFVIGNPMNELLNIYKQEPIKCDILVTIHRSENIDDAFRLADIISDLSFVAESNDVLIMAHPRFIKATENYKLPSNITIKPATTFTEFIKYEQGANIILTDSGTVQEEAAILGKRCIIMRNESERLETFKNAGTMFYKVGELDKQVNYLKRDINENNIQLPNISDYNDIKDTSRMVCNILLSK